MTRSKKKSSRIVSSSHLVSEGSEALSSFEFGLIIANSAFERWIVRCMAAAGYPDLGAMDVLILHSVNHHARPKRIGDICLVLNIEDTHVATYSLKKLARLGLVTSEKSGKENFFRTTAQGITACKDYRAVRETCLIETVNTLGVDLEEADRLADLLRALSGLYDQAARSAAVV